MIFVTRSTLAKLKKSMARAGELYEESLLCYESDDELREKVSKLRLSTLQLNDVVPQLGWS